MPEHPACACTRLSSPHLRGGPLTGGVPGCWLWSWSLTPRGHGRVCFLCCRGLRVNIVTSPLSFQFLVYEVPGQDLEVDLYDEDTDRDDFLGR